MKVNKKAVLQEEKGEAILFDPETLLTFWLNESGILIWKLLSIGESPDSILAQMKNKYEVEEEDLRSDLRAFISALTEQGFISGD
ncbi:MAG: PqqD family protein [Candidatus Aureabacteria bacterium]|nr:PqqD family protein [Candidatus Auribacterota bacterium]